MYRSVTASHSQVNQISIRQSKLCGYAVSESEERVTDVTTFMRMTGCTGMYWAETGLKLGCTELYWVVLGCTELYWAVLGYT